MATQSKTINASAGRTQLEPITADNVEIVAALLQERNDTMRSYTRWKYGQNHDNRFRGVLATLEGAPVGCFGLVARDLVLPDCQRVPCGWFADWFVSSRVRAAGLGTELLQAISKAYPLVFGHPGPEKARLMCLTNGYRPIGFQSRRRLVFRRFEYERTRTHYIAKAAANWLIGWKQSTEARLRSFGESDGLRPLAHFADAEKQGDWILDQPVRLDVIRRSSAWEEMGLTIVFVDDQLPESGLRRRILYTSGHRQFSPEAWKPFVRASREAGCLYLEGFTTQQALDNVWASFGAWRYPDAPVLVHGEPDVADQLFLHGWDRENWTYLAGGPDNG
jgi:hypothetical protein